MRNLRLLVPLLVVLISSQGYSYVVIRGAASPHPEVRWGPLTDVIVYSRWSGGPDTYGQTPLAAQSWVDEERSGVNFYQDKMVDFDSVGRDGVSAISWSPGPSGALMTTWIWSDPSGNILEFDISVNTTDNWHYRAGRPPSGKFDYQGVMTHEFGHALGLADLYDYPFGGDRGKTMYGVSGESNVYGYDLRSLEQDDKDGIAYLYPLPDCENDRVWGRDGDGGLDDGHVPYPFEPYWCSPDIAPTPHPLIPGQPARVFVRVRNMRPTHQTTNATLELHRPSLTLIPGKDVIWSGTMPNVSVPPGNCDADLDGRAEYGKPAGDGETLLVFECTPPNDPEGNNACTFLAIVSSGDDTCGHYAIRNDNNLYQTGAVPLTPRYTGSLRFTFEIGNPLDVPVRRYISAVFADTSLKWDLSLGGVQSGESVGANTARTCTCQVSVPPLTLPGASNLLSLSCALMSPGFGETLYDGGLSYLVRYSPASNVGATAILNPAGSLDYGSEVTPACSVRNYGSNPEYFWVRMNIGPDYTGYGQVAALASGATAYVTFPPWTVKSSGTLAVSCSTLLANDTIPGDDAVSGSVTIVGGTPGWASRASLPSGAKGKNVKDGGCLAFGDELGAGRVFGLKGNNTCEFYGYDPATDAWLAKESIPAIGRALKKKAVKKGAALNSAYGQLYAVKGNNTLEFWKYDPFSHQGYPWTQLADVPAGAKAIKEGSGLVSIWDDSDIVHFFLKGSGTQECYCFRTSADTWERLADAPLGTSGKTYKNGSCLATDGITIWALKGSYNELFAYDFATNSWTQKTTLPFIGLSTKKKKAKDGAGVAYLNGYLYCQKGGNTLEFWRYDVLQDQWTQLGDVPSPTGKRVKGGGALCAAGDVLFSLKGNNTLECWRYIPLAADGYQLLSGGRMKAVQADRTTGRLEFGLRIAPNPLTSCLNPLVSYSLPEAGNVRLKLYDVTGKLVSTLAGGYHPAGSYRVSFRAGRGDLARGVYLLKYESGGYRATQKIIIE